MAYLPTCCWFCMVNVGKLYQSHGCYEVRFSGFVQLTFSTWESKGTHGHTHPTPPCHPAPPKKIRDNYLQLQYFTKPPKMLLRKKTVAWWRLKSKSMVMKLIRRRWKNLLPLAGFWASAHNTSLALSRCSPNHACVALDVKWCQVQSG